jgi:hypothetical protein
MLTSHSNSFVQKRDLHVGGLGSSGSDGSAMLIDPAIELTGSWLHRSKAAVRNANGHVRTNPWTALALVALAGVALGYWLSERSSE